MTSIAPSSIFSSAVQGLHKAGGKAADAAHKLVSGEIKAEHAVELKLAETAHSANAKVIGVADRMQKRLLDLLA